MPQKLRCVIGDLCNKFVLALKHPAFVQQHTAENFPLSRLGMPARSLGSLPQQGDSQPSLAERERRLPSGVVGRGSARGGRGGAVPGGGARGALGAGLMGRIHSG